MDHLRKVLCSAGYKTKENNRGRTSNGGQGEDIRDLVWTTLRKWKVGKFKDSG